MLPENIYLPTRPSSAERWINCAGEPRITAAAAKLKLPDSPVAAQGTRGHAYLEAILNGKGDEYKTQIAIDARDEANQRSCIEEVANDILLLKSIGGYEMKTEQELHIYLAKRKILVHIDVLLISDDEIVVIDYKHGEGHKVETKGNAQLMMYAVTAHRHYPGRRVTIGVYQPRGVGDGLHSYEVPIEELCAWESTFAAAIMRAYHPEPFYKIGPWCQFCEGRKGFCPAHIEATVELALQDKNAVYDVTAFPTWILEIGDAVTAFVSKVKATAFEIIRAGDEIPGWEILTVNGSSKWISADETPINLQKIFGGQVKDYQRVNVTPVTITEAKKLLKGADESKKKEFDKLVFRPKREVLAKSEECEEKKGKVKNSMTSIDDILNESE
jgi:hypothetical protein